jgi:hypothetical protein
MASADGVPNRSVIRSNWWTTFFPGKRAFPVKSSAKMQPMLHISIAGVYWKQNIIMIRYNQERRLRLKFIIAMKPSAGK